MNYSLHTCWIVHVQRLLCFIFAEEKATEVKKSELYRPASNFVPFPQHVSSAESKKAVSCCIDVHVIESFTELRLDVNLLFTLSQHLKLLSAIVQAVSCDIIITVAPFFD